MLIDFKFIHGLTITGSIERLDFLVATGMSILPNVENFNWYIGFNFDIQKHMDDRVKHRLEVLNRVAAINNNKITAFQLDPNLSLAECKVEILSRNFLQLAENDYFLNFDDDMIFTMSALFGISGASCTDQHNTIFTYGCFDIINTHNYPDWDDKYKTYEDLIPFVLKNGTRCIAFHLWNNEGRTQYIRTDDESGASYLMSIKTLKRLNSDFKMFDKMTEYKKGVRGLEAMLFQLFNNAKMPIKYIFGANVLHIGAGDGMFHKVWESESADCLHNRRLDK